MTRYIVHAGTGTIIDIDDDTYIIDTAKLSDEQSDVLADGDDAQIVDLAKSVGEKASSVITDLRFGNCISYSPIAIREEVRESLWEAYSDDDEHRKVLEWAETATDAELALVAEFVLQSDGVWAEYPASVLEGLVEAHAWATRPKS
ncbi:MAG: hypothetical protein ACO395_04680 [Pontimonas sp.]